MKTCKRSSCREQLPSSNPNRTHAKQSVNLPKFRTLTGNNSTMQEADTNIQECYGIKRRSENGGGFPHGRDPPNYRLLDANLSGHKVGLSDRRLSSALLVESCG